MNMLNLLLFFWVLVSTGNTSVGATAGGVDRVVRGETVSKRDAAAGVAEHSPRREGSFRHCAVWGSPFHLFPASLPCLFLCPLGEGNGCVTTSFFPFTRNQTVWIGWMGAGVGRGKDQQQH